MTQTQIHTTAAQILPGDVARYVNPRGLRNAALHVTSVRALGEYVIVEGLPLSLRKLEPVGRRTDILLPAEYGVIVTRSR